GGNPHVARAAAHMMTSAAAVQPFTHWRRCVRNVVANWASFVIGVLINLVLSPFIIHSLGDGAYGAWVLLSSLVAYLGLLDLGTRGAVTRYVATYHAAHRHEDAGRIASTALVLFSGLGLVQLGVSVLRGGASAWLSYRAYPELAVRVSSWSRRHLREISSFGISSAFLLAAGSVINYANTLVIGAFLPVEMITFFAIAS